MQTFHIFYTIYSSKSTIFTVLKAGIFALKNYECLFKRWQALSFLVAGAFLSPLDYFIVNMALPAIQKTFNASDQQLQLVVAIYGLTYAALVVCGGRLGDIYGRKKIFSLGLYIFLFSSVACAFSPDISVLIIARLFQGVGASLLAPQVLASVRVLFNSTEQPKAVSVFSSVFGLASVAGQLLGAFCFICIGQVFHGRWCFW